MGWSDMETNAGGLRWDQKGQEVTGEIVGLGETTNGEGIRCPQVTIRTPKGDELVSAYQTDLRHQLIVEARENGDLNVGDRIRIRYLGDKALNGGRTLKQFEVTVRRAATPAVVDVVELADDGEAF